ncbi:MAG: hypothetical protein IBX52_09890 [Bacterioplanes sp.]|nr:hypothetical protein [Bacterioplanes sp.]
MRSARDEIETRSPLLAAVSFEARVTALVSALPDNAVVGFCPDVKRSDVD